MGWAAIGLHLIHPFASLPLLNAKNNKMGRGLRPMQVYGNWRENADTAVKTKRGQPVGYPAPCTKLRVMPCFMPARLMAFDMAACRKVFGPAYRTAARH